MKGAHEIKKIIKKMLGPKFTDQRFIAEDFCQQIAERTIFPITIKKLSDRLTLAKSLSFDQPTQIDFAMTFRIRKVGASFELWPTSFSSCDGRKIVAEKNLKGKILTNCAVQNQLIKTANTWGKALLSQRVQLELKKVA